MAWVQYWTGSLSTAKDCPTLLAGNTFRVETVIVPALSQNDWQRISNSTIASGLVFANQHLYYTRLKNNAGQEVASQIALEFGVPRNAGISLAYGAASGFLGACQAVAQAYGFSDAGLGVRVEDTTDAYKAAETTKQVQNALKPPNPGVWLAVGLIGLLAVVVWMD